MELAYGSRTKLYLIYYGGTTNSFKINQEVKTMATPVYKRRRRKPVPVVDDEPEKNVDARPSFIAKKPVLPRPVQYPEGTRRLYEIGLSLFNAYPKFGEDTHPAYPELRELFCLAYADQEHQQTGENAEPVKLWTGREVITGFIAKTKSVRLKAVKVLREELASHLEYLEDG